MIASGLVACLLQSPGEAPKEARLYEGRVRDAFTGRGVENAEVELFTENAYGEAELVLAARTGPDGRYRIEDRERRGEKLRVRHPRYRSTMDGEVSADESLLFPRDEPCEIVLRDLEGRPIAGATVLLRQTCHHAVPTTSAVSDAEGRVLLADLPPLRDDGELEVLAAGFAALTELEPWDLSARNTFYLARRKPLSLRLLDEDGSPLGPGTCVYDDGNDSYPLVPDAGGRVKLAVLLERSDGAVQRAGSFRHELPPAGDEFTLRFAQFPRVADPATLVVRLAGAEDEEPVPLGAFHRDGYLYQGLLEPRDVLPGAWRVVVGRPFSGYRESIVEIELAPREVRTLELALEREPRLRVLLPDDHWTVHVQTGGDSETFYAEAELETGVPPGAEVIVLAQGREVRRARHAPWSGELTLDLREPAALLEPAAPDAPPFELVLRARTPEGEPLAVEAGALTRGASPKDEDPSPDGVRLRFPAGARWEASVRAEGHVTLYRAGVAAPGGSAAEDVVLPRE